MDLGLFLSYQVNSPSQVNDVYQRMFDYADAADQAGFRQLWFPEHHLVQFLPSPSALLPAAAIGQRVQCRVGTAVVVLPYHAPLQLAGEIAATDQLLGGRFELGVARGAYEYEFDIFGLDFKKSLDHFIEMLEAMRALWLNSDEPTSFIGDHVQFEDAYVWPRPQQDPHPPIWIGAQSTYAVEDAAARGYNVLNGLFLWDYDHAAEVAEAFHKGKARAPEGTEPKLGMSRYGLVCDSSDEVDDRIMDMLEGWRIHQQLHDYTQNAALGVVESVPQEGEPSMDAIERNLLIGTLDDVEEKLAFYDEIGVDLLTINGCFGAPHDAVLRSLELFGKTEFCT